MKDESEAAEPVLIVAKRRWTSRIVTRRALKRLAILFIVLAILIAVGVWYCCSMPGTSYRGPLPAATTQQFALAARLQTHVEALASKIGGRSTYYPRTGAAAARYLQGELLAMGYTEVNETFVERGSRVPNLEVVLTGTKPDLPCVVVGAHYDTYQGTPGADDNASGCAGVLELARAFASTPQARTIRFVLFVNEEPPAFQTKDMGSWVYAKSLQAAGVQVAAMLSLECIGYYRTEPGSQKYPLPGLGSIYPDTGDFIAFAGDWTSRTLVHRAIGSFRANAQFPSEGAVLPGFVPGVGWSDHWAFWQEGIPAIMVTGTAPFRNPNYHTVDDTPATLDYDRMSRVVEGLEQVVRNLSSN